MTTSIHAPSRITTERTTAVRVASIDVLRGLTMMVMVFVNELSGVRGLP